VEIPAKPIENTPFSTGFWGFFVNKNSGLPYPQKPKYPTLTRPAGLLRFSKQAAIFPRQCGEGRFEPHPKMRIACNPVNWE
jgi:hypothetical protein